MATWQFDFHLLPRSKILERYSRAPAQLSDEEFTAIDWWSGFALPGGYDSVLESFLPKYTSWNKDASTWGDENSDLIEIFFENNVPVEIFVRIDVRKLDINLLGKVSHFAKFCHCMLFLGDSEKLIEPDPLSLNYEIERSKAYKYVTDPNDFLDEISNKLKGR